MAEKMLGSGSSDEANQENKLPALGIPGMLPGAPWVDPIRYEQQKRMGVAGVMLRNAKLKSRSIGLGKFLGRR